LGLPNGPWHVVELDGATARVIVAPPADALITQVNVAETTWLRDIHQDEQVLCKVRYQMRPSPCSITIDADKTVLTFDEPQRPTAPGQVAAFYIGDELVGGGIVSSIDK